MRLALLGLVVGCSPHLDSTLGHPVDWEEPTNGWPLAEPPSDIAEEGWGIGDIVPDIRLMDQFGDELSLWQFHGLVVLLDIGAVPCGPCQDLALGAEASYQAYRDEDFIYLTVLIYGEQGGDPTLDDLVGWADSFGITAPVTSDPQGVQTDRAIQNGAIPAVLVIDRELRIAERVSPATVDFVDAAIERAL